MVAQKTGAKRRPFSEMERDHEVGVFSDIPKWGL